MTKEELVSELKKDHYKKPYEDVFVAAYNLAIVNAAAQAQRMINGGTTEFLIPTEILNLKITE